MGFELPNGKTARNLQEQVKFLTEKIKELVSRVNELELHIEIVDELPETGSSDVIYFVPVEDPEEGNYYNEYMWIDDAWELIGTTQIDLSGYVDLASTQTITGEKTFRDLALSASDSYDANKWYIRGWGASGLDIGLRGENKGIKIQEGSVSPLTTNATDLGGINKWKNIYSNGKSFYYNPNTSKYAFMTLDQWGNLNIGLNVGTGDYNYFAFSNTEFYPTSSASKHLGTLGYTWKDAYFSEGLYIISNNKTTKLWENASGTFLISYENNDLMFFYDASKIIFNCNVVPNGSGKDLGDQYDFWRDAYISRNLTDGTNTVSVAQIASGIGGTYRHIIYIEGASADINIAVNLNSATAITTQAALAAINNNVMGGTATLDEQSRYRIVAIDSVGNVGSITYLDETGQHTLNIVDIYQDVVNQI